MSIDMKLIGLGTANTAFFAGATALTAVAVGNPVGAAGGAIYGICHKITQLASNLVIVNYRALKDVACS